MRWGYLASAAALALAGCADPHFIHDPQIGFFRREQLPPLLKSLRCELATYIAANNQRHIINAYRFPTHPVEANRDFAFFPIDPARYGGMSMELKIQDTLGTQSGTAFDWKRTPPDGIHTKIWHIGPNLGTQNSYDVLGGFLLPQDIYGLDTSDRPSRTESDVLNGDAGEPYLCYKHIPHRNPPIVSDLRVVHAVYVQQDLDAIAAGRRGIAQFDRIRVNGDLPLAEWLLQASTTMTSPSLVQSDVQHNEAMLPGQLTYTFAIQTTAGVDIRNTIATTLWTGIGGEVQGQWQHTGTLTIVLNGADAAATSGVKSGSTARQASQPIIPPPKGAPPVTTYTELQYCPMPFIGKASKPSKWCFWPPPPPIVERVAATKKPTKPFEGPAIKEVLPQKKPQPPAKKPAPKKPTQAPAFRDFGEHGVPIYPLPLSPLGGSTGF